MRIDKNVRMKFRELLAARHEPEAYRRLARGYWMFLVALCALASAAGIAMGAREFMNGVTQEGKPEVRAQTSLSKTQLQEVLDGFRGRVEKYESLRAAPRTVRDPS